MVFLFVFCTGRPCFLKAEMVIGATILVRSRKKEDFNHMNILTI